MDCPVYGKWSGSEEVAEQLKHIVACPVNKWYASNIFEVVQKILLKMIFASFE